MKTAGKDRISLRIALLGAAGFLVAINWQVVVPVLPVHLSRIGFSNPQIGLLVSLFSLAMGIGEFEFGRAAAIFGQRWTLLGGLILFAMTMVWLALARSAVAVAGGLLAVGAARATMWTPLHVSVAATASEETRGRAFGVFWFLTSAAFLAGPAIGGWVAAKFGEHASFYLGSVIGLITIPLAVTITDPGRLMLRLTASGAVKVLLERVNFRIFLANHLHYAISAIWSTFLPLYAVAQGLSVLTIGEVFAVQGLAYALAQLPTGRLTDRLGAERLIIPSLIGRSAVSLLIPLVHTAGGLLTAGAIYGLAGGLVPVTFTTLVARHNARDHYTTAMGVYNCSGDLGFFIGPVLGGAAALIGITGPFLLCGPLGIALVLTGRSLKAAIAQAQD